MIRLYLNLCHSTFLDVHALQLRQPPRRLNKPSELGGPIAWLCADIREIPDNYEFDSLENIRSKSDHDVWIGRTLSGISMFSLVFATGSERDLIGTTIDWFRQRAVSERLDRVMAVRPQD